MADAKPIKLTLQTIAKTGDVEQLIEYLGDLEKSLSAVGTAGAKAFQDKLANAMKKAMAQKASGNAGADFVKSMLPDIGRDKALYSISQIYEKLGKYGTAQAKNIQRSVTEIRNALESGELSGDTIGILEKSLEKFVEQANKLPPPGMKKFGDDIRKVVANTQELQEVIADVNGIDFKVKTDGTGSIDELMHKLEVISNAKNLDDGLNQLADALDTLDPAKADDVAKQIERIRTLLNGELGKKQVAELNALMRDLSASTQGLGSKDLQKLAAQLANVTQHANALGDSMRQTGNALADSFSKWDALEDLIRGNTEQIGKYVTAMVAKVAAKFKSFAGGSAAAITGAAGFAAFGISQAIGMLGNKFDEWKHEISDLRDQMRKSLDDTVSTKFDMLEYANRARQTRRKQWDETESNRRLIQDAQFSLRKNQVERERDSEMLTAYTEEEKFDINRRSDRKTQGLEYEQSLVQNARKREDTVRDLEDAKRELKDIEKNLPGIQNAISELNAKREEYGERYGNDAGALRKIWENAKAKIGLGDSVSMEDATGEVRSYQELINEANKRLKEVIGRRRELEGDKKLGIKSELDIIRGRIAVIDKDRQLIKDKRDAVEREWKLADKEERLRKWDVEHARSRERELFEYDEDTARRQYEEQRRNRRNDLYDKSAIAQGNIERFTAEMEEAAKVMREIENRNRGTDWNPQDVTLYSEAKSDYQRARSSMYSAQTEKDDVEYQLVQRRYERAEYEHGINREDEEFARNGQYGRANYAQRLRMDRRRYDESKRAYEQADENIRAHENGSRVLTPEYLKVEERKRSEARQYMTSTRESIRSALFEGDQQGASFMQSLFGHGNRLTRMGLGGDMGDYDRVTARNTSRLVKNTEALLREVAQRDRGNFGSGWGL